MFESGHTVSQTRQFGQHPNQDDNLKIANNMNVKSHDVVSLFKEMNYAIAKVLGNGLGRVNYLIIDKEIVGAIQESANRRSFLMRPIQIDTL